MVKAVANLADGFKELWYFPSMSVWGDIGVMNGDEENSQGAQDKSQRLVMAI